MKNFHIFAQLFKAFVALLFVSIVSAHRPEQGDRDNIIDVSATNSAHLRHHQASFGGRRVHLLLVYIIVQDDDIYDILQAFQTAIVGLASYPSWIDRGMGISSFSRLSTLTTEIVIGIHAPGDNGF
jgi:hypothetical protein